MTNFVRRITDFPFAGKGGSLATPVQPSDAREDPRERALAAVYRDYGEFVWRSAGHLGVPDAHRDDVVHDVFLVVYRRLDQFEVSRGSWRSWLFGITKRVALHHRRAAARHQRRLRVVPTPPARPQPDEALARRRAAERIEAFLGTLPPAQRLVFTLTDLEEMSAAEVARSLELNANTVYARLRAARRAFTRYLDSLEADDVRA